MYMALLKLETENTYSMIRVVHVGVKLNCHLFTVLQSQQQLFFSIGLNLTGMYLQPAMATGHTFGCGSTPVLFHIMVYWGGPFLGIYIGLKVNFTGLYIDLKVNLT
jgi:hypothetical protein